MESIWFLRRLQADGIFMVDYEQSVTIYSVPHAAMGLEGIVSKHRGRAYRGGRCKHWLKVKNRAHPAYNRVRDLHMTTWR